MRGTQLTDFRLETATTDAVPNGFGPHSATALSAIRLRFNMNTVRIPMNVADAARADYFSQLAKLVNGANRIDLLVILAADAPADFWARCAAQFKNYPNVMFDAARPDAVQSIRAAGAQQPIIVAAGDSSLADPNIIYEVFPKYSALRADAGRDAQFGSLAERVPVLATGWDPEFEDAAECAAFPPGPESATALVRSNLEYMDAHHISWSASVYEPGKLIKDYSLQDASTLENGWTCGKRGLPGIGRVVEGYLRRSDERGLFVVSTAGGVDIARGGFAVAYGPVMAQQDTQGDVKHLAFELGKVHVEVTDATGVTRPAGIMWASAGWGQINFVIPPDSALGPARMNVVRADGSRTGANIIVADTAPGFWTTVSCRGPAVGLATQVFADGHKAVSTLSECKDSLCRTMPIPVAQGATTRIQMRGSGFRNVSAASKIEVTIGGHRVPVVAYGPAPEAGIDTITIEIPASLRGLGETELLCHINGRVSNAVQVRIGGGKPVS